MSCEAPALVDAEAPDGAIRRAERRLRLLEELTEIVMDLVRALRPGAVGEMGTGEAPRRDPAELYASLSRAVRLTLALEARTDADLAALRAGLPVARETALMQARDAADRRKDAHRNRVQDCVVRVIEAEAETPDQFDGLWEALDQRLEEDGAYGDIEAWPLREIVERLCRDLCLEPDWSRWTGEGWGEAARPHRPRYCPFNHPSPRPIDLYEDGPPPHDLE